MRKKVFLLTSACVITGVLVGCGSTQSTSGNVNNKTAAEARPVGNSATSNGNVNSANNAATQTQAFKKTFELHGIKFTVESPNTASENSVKITPEGLAVSNETITAKVNGSVLDAEIGDLNIDQSPEIFVFYRERDGMKRARVIAYAANKKKSLSEINMHEPNTVTKEYAGYNGEDDMAIVESVLVHRFPLFGGSGADAKKTGKTRQIQYKIKPGEATWQFYVDRTAEY